MKKRRKKQKMSNKDKSVSFAERHPKLNLLLGFILFVLLCSGVVCIAILLFRLLMDGFLAVKSFLKIFVDSTDKVIVVAMITGTVSIIGVVISSIVAKVVDYRFNKKKYLYDKREEPYKQFIEMIYTIMEDSKKEVADRMREEERIKMISDFSKGLTLWGTNRVVKKWLKYRKSTQNNAEPDTLLQLEDIIYEIRKDVGSGKRMKKGNILSIFVNDIEQIINSAD